MRWLLVALTLGLSASALDTQASAKPTCPDGSSPPCSDQGGGGQVRIASLDDIYLGRWLGWGALEGEDAHCVLGGKPNGRFKLIARGSGPNGSFELNNGAAALSYQVFYNDKQLQSGQPKDFQGLKKNKDFDDCLYTGSQREELRVRISEDELGRAEAGNYRGTLRLMVEPD